MNADAGPGRRPWRAAAKVAGACLFVTLLLVALGTVVSAVLEATGVVSFPKPTPRTATDDASFAVAGATLLLADLTAGLAYFTFKEVGAARRQEVIAAQALEQSRQMAAAAEKQAAASEEQAAAASRTLAASWQPMLVDVPTRDELVWVESNAAGDYDCSVPLRNIGAGTAILTGLDLTVMGESGPPGRMVTTIVPPGEVTRIGFRLQADDPRNTPLIDNLKRGNGFEASVSYTDQQGTSPGWQTTAHVSRIRATVWAVRQVGLYRPPGAETPYVMSGPTSEDVGFS